MLFFFEMARRRTASNPNFSLDSGDLSHLPMPEIRQILRGAESLIGSGGRTTLVKILRGSKAQKILPFQANPAYGSFAEDSKTLVEQKVDWCIKSGYLKIIRKDDFPLLAYSDKGLMIECLTIAEESLITLQVNPESLFAEIRNYPLKTVNAMFDLIAERGPEIYAESLRKWEAIGTKRMKARIRKIFAEWENTAAPERYIFETCVLDEGISQLEWKKLEPERKKLMLVTAELRLVSVEFPGMPDVDIYRKISKLPNTCIVTSDCVFHNSLVEKKFPSFYYDKTEGRLSRHQIAGVKPRGIFTEMGEPSIARHADDEGDTITKQIPEFLYPTAEKQQKRARTKRRRIKNYFGGSSRMDECRVTVSISPGAGRHIIGFKANITSNSGLKSLDATESYLECDITQNPEVAFSIVLGQLRLLGIRKTPVIFYYDKNSLPGPPETLLRDRDLELWEYLHNESEAECRFLETQSKNPRMAQLQRKLQDLKKGKSNELVRFDYDEMKIRFEASEKH